MELAEQVPEVHVTEATKDPDKDVKNFSGNPGDFAKDIASIAAEMGVQSPLAPQEPVAEEQPEVEATAQPEPEKGQPQAAEQPKPEVPKKFQTADGQLDESKLEKSTKDAETALEKYKAMEAELKRKQNEVRKLQSGVGQEQPKPQAEPESFEALIEQDVQKQGLGKTLAKLFEAAKDAAYQQARQDVEGVAQEIHWNKMERELEAIGKSDPWVFSEEGMNTLGGILNERPYLQQSPRKWTEAYEIHLGRKALQEMNGSQVKTPTPTAKTAKAPASPVSAASRSAAPKVNINDPKELEAYLNKMSPSDQEKFWDRMLPGRRK